MNSNQKNRGLYRTQFEHDNCGIGAVVNSKGIKSHTTVENALKYCCRFPINFSVKYARSPAFPSETKESMELHSFFCRRTNLSAIRQRKCLKLL